MTTWDWHHDTALVGGTWVSADASLPVSDPATGCCVASGADCDASHVDAAVDAAAAAFAGWSSTAPRERSGVLRALHAELRERRSELIAATVAEVGAPVRVVREAHVDISLDILASYVDLLEREQPEDWIRHSLVVREAAGVVGSITPWNYPLYQLMIKLAAALSAGCTVVAKPSELTPLSAYLLADAATAAGVPPGVVNLVPGSGAVVGEALAAHPGLDVLSFTGSSAVGARVAALAAGSVTRVSLELGGKSPSVVLDDADLGSAVATTVESATYNSGQTCSAWTRLLVPRADYHEAVRLAAEHADRLVVGDPTREETDMGPLISERQLTSVRQMVEEARVGGATVHQAAVPVDGLFYGPTIVSDVSPQDRIVREEVFGPVLVVLPHDGDDDAVRLANDSDYGLAGAVWSADEQRALRVARSMRTGQVDVNGAEFNLWAPFGGYGQSGYGRELGRFGLEEFQSVKSVQLQAEERC